MYIPDLLKPKAGDILERWCSENEMLLGIFLVVEPDRPLCNGQERRDLVETRCLYNRHFNAKFSSYGGAKAGDRCYIHTVHLLNKWDAQATHRTEYFLIRQKDIS